MKCPLKGHFELSSSDHPPFLKREKLGTTSG